MSDQRVLELIRARKPQGNEPQAYTACPSCHFTYPVKPGVGEVMTAEEAAKLLKTTPWQVANQARQGKLPGFRFGGRWRFRVDELQKWMDQGGTAS